MKISVLLKIFICFFVALSGTMWAAQSNTASGSKSPLSRSKRYSSQLHHVKARSESLAAVPENATLAESPLASVKDRLKPDKDRFKSDCESATRAKMQQLCESATQAKMQQLNDAEKKKIDEKKSKEDLNQKNEMDFLMHVVAITCNLTHNKEYMRAKVYKDYPAAKLLKMTNDQEKEKLTQYSLEQVKSDLVQFIGSQGNSVADAQAAVDKMWLRLTPQHITRDENAHFLYNLNVAIHDLWTPSVCDSCEELCCCCTCYEARGIKK